MTEIDKKQTLIWIDLEMTGLIPETDRIIEIATLITDAQLNILAEGPVLAVHQSDDALAAMDDWNSWKSIPNGAPPPCVATASARTGVSWRATCRSWRNSSIIAIWT